MTPKEYYSYRNYKKIPDWQFDNIVDRVFYTVMSICLMFEINILFVENTGSLSAQVGTTFLVALMIVTAISFASLVLWLSYHSICLFFDWIRGY